MSFDQLRKRLDRIEAGRGGTAPTVILTDRPIPEPGEPNEQADALTNWRQWIVAGRARRHGDVLCITDPEMTPEEWEARFVTEH